MKLFCLSWVWVEWSAAAVSISKCVVWVIVVEENEANWNLIQDQTLDLSKGLFVKTGSISRLNRCEHKNVFVFIFFLVKENCLVFKLDEPDEMNQITQHPINTDEIECSWYGGESKSWCY